MLNIENLNKEQSGVTIVELMIVVAVAALLLVLVLVAAPALQRSGANTTRRNDIGAIRGQLQVAATSNNGALPTAGADFDTAVLGQIKPSLYNLPTSGSGLTTIADVSGTVYYAHRTAAVLATRFMPHPDSIHIWVGLKCGSITTGNPATDGTALYTAGTTDVATSRVYAVIYHLEGEALATCEDSS